MELPPFELENFLEYLDDIASKGWGDPTLKANFHHLAKRIRSGEFGPEQLEEVPLCRNAPDCTNPKRPGTDSDYCEFHYQESLMRRYQRAYDDDYQGDDW